MEEPRTFHIQVRIPRLPIWAWIVAGVFAYFVVAGAVSAQIWDSCAERASIIEDNAARARFLRVYCDEHPATFIPALFWPITLPWRVGGALFS